MFDDKPIVPQGQAPQNLPLGEPEDLFAETEASSEASVSEDTLEMPALAASPAGPASALDAGILKPKATIESVPAMSPSSGMGLPPVPPPVNPVSMPEQTLPLQTLKEPTLSRGIMTGIIIIITVLLLGGAVWWVYRYINIPSAPATETPTTDFVPDETANNSTNPDQTSNTTGDTDNAVAPPDVTSSQPVDETILFGQIPDSDNDGLDDKREEALGTDPKKVDTDSDGFTDGDEVIVWETDPLNSDTDGDGYLDGNEFKAGFNPKGPGKLFEAPTNSSVTSTNTVSSTP